MANNPFVPTAAAAAPAAPAAPTAAAAVDGDKKPRKRTAKSLTSDQLKEVITRAKAGETPKETADAMGIERNQAYNFVRKLKTTLQSKIDDETSTPEQKAKAQAALAEFPVREFGATAGEKRTSSSATAIADLLSEIGL